MTALPVLGVTSSMLTLVAIPGRQLVELSAIDALIIGIYFAFVLLLRRKTF